MRMLRWTRSNLLRKFHLKPNTTTSETLTARSTLVSDKHDQKASQERIEQIETMTDDLKTGLIRTFTRFAVQVWAGALTFSIVFCWLAAEDRDTLIRIPLSETTTLSKFTEMQREAKRECINLQLEDLTPMPSAHVDQMREKLELQLFENLALIEEVKYYQENRPYIIYSILGSATAYYHYKLQQKVGSSVSGSMLKKSAFIQALSKRWVIFSVTMFGQFITNHFPCLESINSQFLLEAKYRAIGFMENNAFYRMIIQAYGAQGIAMVRFMKGSKDEELMKFVRDYLHFHEDYDEDEEDDSIFSRVKLSISTAEDDDPFSQDENKKCFMESSDNLVEFMEDGAQLYGKQKLAGIKNDLNKRLLSKIQAKQKALKRFESGRRELGPKEISRISKKFDEIRKDDPLLDYYSRLISQRDMRHFYLDNYNAAFCSALTDKSQLSTISRLVFWVTYPIAAYFNSFGKCDNGQHWTRCIRNGQFDLEWFYYAFKLFSNMTNKK